MLLPAAHLEFCRSAASHSLVLRAERTVGNVARLGAMIDVPLYDGTISTPPRNLPENLRYLGIVHARQHRIRRDVGGNSFGGYDAASDRVARFLAVSRGAGSVNVLLRLPALHERCVSCRTVHFYFDVR